MVNDEVGCECEITGWRHGYAWCLMDNDDHKDLI